MQWLFVIWFTFAIIQSYALLLACSIYTSIAYAEHRMIASCMRIPFCLHILLMLLLILDGAFFPSLSLPLGMFDVVCVFLFCSVLFRSSLSACLGSCLCILCAVFCIHFPNAYTNVPPKSHEKQTMHTTINMALQSVYNLHHIIMPYSSHDIKHIQCILSSLLLLCVPNAQKLILKTEI